MSNKPRLLVVDDSYADNRYIELLINVEGFDLDCEYKESAIEALKYLQNCEPTQFPNIILVDINMPLMNGFEFAAEFERLYCNRYSSTRVFIMSSSCRLSEVEKAKQLGAVEDFFEKPLTTDYLARRILKKEIHSF